MINLISCLNKPCFSLHKFLVAWLVGFFVMQETEDKSDMFVQRACEIQNVKFERLKKLLALITA